MFAAIQHDLEPGSEIFKAMQEFRGVCETSSCGSQCYEYGSLGYKDSIRHFIASSSDVAQLAVQPGSAEDLGKMMKILNKYSTVKFAVRGGGHAMAPGFSSTTGIQISMTRFTTVKYFPHIKLVEVGAGCLWEQVYSHLVPFKRNVVGGASAQGVGVAGWLLGGGYSLKSNQYGLGIDHVVAYEIVLPDGSVRTVTAEKEGRLFQALRGGGNNFGIVTKFTLKTHAQGETYGTSLMVPGTRAEEVKDSIASFVETEKRKEAAIVAAFRHTLVDGQPDYNISVLCVFDAEKPKYKRDLPFQEFKRLAKYGDIYKVDPAGWMGGAQVVEIRRPERRPLQSVVFRKEPSPMESEFDSSNGFSPANSDEADEDEDMFEEMSWQKVYQIASHPANNINSLALRQSNADLEVEATGSLEYYVDADAELFETEESDVETLAQKHTFTTNFMLPLMKHAPVFKPKQVTKKVDSMSELNVRGRFACLMISRYTKPLLDAISEEAEKCAQYLKPCRGRLVLFDAWPFHASIFDQSPPGAAFPHHPGHPFGPLLAYFQWEDEQDDKFWLEKLKGSLYRIRVVARQLGLTTESPAYYNNLSLETMPAHWIYRDNMGWLSEVKAEYDPTDVMARAGGHKIPLPGKRTVDI